MKSQLRQQQSSISNCPPPSLEEVDEDKNKNKNALQCYSVHYVLLKACFDGDVDMVKTLLLDKRVDPATADTGLLGAAISQGHVDVAEILLDDKRVIPLPKDLFDANEAGYIGVVDQIKRHPSYRWITDPDKSFFTP